MEKLSKLYISLGCDYGNQHRRNPQSRHDQEDLFLSEAGIQTPEHQPL